MVDSPVNNTTSPLWVYQAVFPGLPKKTEANVTIPYRTPEQLAVPQTENFYGLEITKDLVKNVNTENKDYTDDDGNLHESTLVDVSLKNGIQMYYEKNALNLQDSKAKVYMSDDGYTTFENMPECASIDGTNKDDKISLINGKITFLHMAKGKDSVRVENQNGGMITTSGDLTLLDADKDVSMSPSLVNTDIILSKNATLQNNLFWTKNVNFERE